jgi:ectoine hydroxylase-related dioxygenase (phytanoyl-CoA dioxygenase family)
MVENSQQSEQVESIFQCVESNGYYIWPKFFDLDELDLVKSELLSLIEENRLEREKTSGRYPHISISGSALTKEMHVITFPCFKKQRVATLVERVFTDPIIVRVLEKICGENFRLRTDVVRKSTGVNDWVDKFQIPHGWHRDTSGEFTFGIIFDDATDANNGSTGVIPGTHWQPYNPVWDFIFSKKSMTTNDEYMAGNKNFIEPVLTKFSLVNKLLTFILKRKRLELTGGKGTLYFFLNDTWHGHWPNTSNKELLMMRVGGMATDFAFKDDLPLPEVAYGKLPLELERRFNKNQAVNHYSDTLFQRMKRRKTKSDLYRLAFLEKKLINRINKRLFMEKE